MSSVINQTRRLYPVMALFRCTLRISKHSYAAEEWKCEQERSTELDMLGSLAFARNLASGEAPLPIKNPPPTSRF